MSAFAIILSLLERETTGKGTIIDNSFTDSTTYLSSFLLSMKRNNFWNEERGGNHLDTGAPFYAVYECRDNKFLCVGAIESKFYKAFLQGLGLEKEKIIELLPNQLKKKTWEKTKQLFTKIIKEKTSKEWEIEVTFYLFLKYL